MDSARSPVLILAVIFFLSAFFEFVCAFSSWSFAEYHPTEFADMDRGRHIMMIAVKMYSRVGQSMHPAGC